MIRRWASLPHVWLALATLFWAGNNVVARAVVSDIPPVALSFWRWMVAFLIVTPFAWPKVRAQWPLIRSNWRLLAVLGCLGVAGYNTFVNLAVTTTTAINVSLVNAVTPAVTVIVAWAMIGTVVSPRVVVGMALSFAGITTIIAQGEVRTLLEFTVNRGDLLMLPAVVAWAFYTVSLRHRPAALDPLALIWATFLVGVMVVGVGYAVEYAIIGRGFALSVPNLAAIGYVGLFPSLLAFVFWNRGIEELGAAAGAQFQNLTPIWGTLGGVALLGEALELFHLAGIAFIFAGIYLAGRR
jgi:drug/metabolite transporter (DMT)-like permease